MSVRWLIAAVVLLFPVGRVAAAPVQQVASIVQQGDGNTATIEQVDPDAIAAAEQIGDANILSARQHGASTLHASVQGDHNALDVVQDDLAGAGSDATLLVLGSDNGAVIAQQAVAGRNAVELIQEGSGNEASLIQVGSDNAMSLTQTGDVNIAALSQYGSGLALGVEQAGGAAIIVTQTNR